MFSMIIEDGPMPFGFHFLKLMFEDFQRMNAHLAGENIKASFMHEVTNEFVQKFGGGLSSRKRTRESNPKEKQQPSQPSIEGAAAAMISKLDHVPAPLQSTNKVPEVAAKKRRTRKETKKGPTKERVAEGKRPEDVGDKDRSGDSKLSSLFEEVDKAWSVLNN
jgi:hypothetical protein